MEFGHVGAMHDRLLWFLLFDVLLDSVIDF